MHVLHFDTDNSSFVLDGVMIGPAVSPESLAKSFGVVARFKPDNLAWSFVEVDRKPVSASTTFCNERLHSGCFWVNLPTGGWSNYLLTEKARRIKHKRLMADMFGSECFANGIIRVDLVHDPRFGLEQIAFNLL